MGKVFSATDGGTQPPSTFLFDSGASTHMHVSKEHLFNCHACEPAEIALGDNSTLRWGEMASIKLTVGMNRTSRKLLLRNALYVTKFSYTLIYSSRLREENSIIRFFKNDNGVQYGSNGTSGPTVL